MPIMRIALVLALFCAPLVTQAATLLVLYKNEHTLAMVDPATAQEKARIPTGNGPHEVEASADGRLAYVSNYGVQGAPGKSLTIVDLQAGKVLRTVDLGMLARPHGLWAVGNDAVYFSAEGAKAVGRYNAKADKVDWQFETGEEGTHMVIAGKDGRHVYTSNIGSNSISIIDTSGNVAVQTLVAVGKGPEGLDVSPDGRELWTAHSGDGHVSVVDLGTSKVTATFDIGTKRANRLKFTPDGRAALVSDLTGGELVVIDVAKRSVRTRLNVGAGASGIQMMPDGSRAYVAISGEQKLSIIDLRSMSVVGSVATGKTPDGMAWVR